MDVPQTERTDAAGNPLRQIPLPQDSLGRQEPTLAARGKRAAADNLHVGSRTPEFADELPPVPRERLGAAERMRYGLRRWGLPAARVAGLLTVLIRGALVVREAADGRIFMLQRLEMTGDVQKVPLARLKEAVEPAAAGKTFFTVDLKAVRDAAETVPWVQYAAVRRVWPDALMIDVTVYEAAAVYEDGRLVSGEGQLFSANPDEGSETAGAPTFRGEAQAVPEMLRRWRRFSGLTEHIPAKITELELSDRGSWTLTIESPTIPPTKIELGRDANGAAVEERLRQVVEAYPRIVEIMGGPPASLDARYRRAIAAGKVNREQVAEYLASVQAVSAQSSARPSLGDADGAADAAAEAEASSSKDSVDDIEAASAADDAADAASSESHETEGGAAAR